MPFQKPGHTPPQTVCPSANLVMPFHKPRHPFHQPRQACHKPCRRRLHCAEIGAVRSRGTAGTACGPRKDLILLTNCAFILGTRKFGPQRVLAGGSAIRWRSLQNVQTALVGARGGGNSGGCAPGHTRHQLRHPICFGLGSLDRCDVGAAGSCGLLVCCAAIRHFWQAGLASGFIISGTRFLQSVRLHVVL